MDIETMLKRTKKLLTYFAKTVSSDKILQCLVCTVALVIVILIILKISGKGNSFKIADQA